MICYNAQVELTTLKIMHAKQNEEGGGGGVGDNLSLTVSVCVGVHQPFIHRS